MGLSKILGIRKCSNCGENIEIRHKNRMEIPNVFCSKKCEIEYKRNNVNLNCICSYCGKKFHKKPSHIQKSKNHYCSNECKNNHMKELMKGERNHQYGLKGNKNSSWKSDETITKYGYKKIRTLNHPFKDCDGFVLEHRLIAEKFLLNEKNRIEIDGKYYLSPKYNIHHINGNKLDNRPENLQILTRSEHSKLHQKLLGHNVSDVIKVPKERKIKSKIESKCPVCGKIFVHYEEENRTCCNVKCSNIFKNRATIEFVCDYCGKISWMKMSRYKKSQTHFCSRNCYTKYRNNKKSHQ